MSAQVTPILKQLKSLAQRPLSEATAPPKDLYTLPEICDLEQERIFPQLALRRPRRRSALAGRLHDL